MLSNAHYAYVGGIQLKELNRLEHHLVIELDFDLHIDPDEYRAYESALGALLAPQALRSPPSPGAGRSGARRGAQGLATCLGGVCAMLRAGAWWLGSRRLPERRRFGRSWEGPNKGDARVPLVHAGDQEGPEMLQAMRAEHERLSPPGEAARA